MPSHTQWSLTLTNPKLFSSTPPELRCYNYGKKGESFFHFNYLMKYNLKMVPGHCSSFTYFFTVIIFYNFYLISFSFIYVFFSLDFMQCPRRADVLCRATIIATTANVCTESYKYCNFSSSVII